MPEEKRESQPKILPSSMRPKSRYIVFEIISENPVIEYKDFVDALWTSLLNLVGELGASETQLRVIKNLYDEKMQRGILKCKNDVIELVRASMTTIIMIGESRSIVKITGVTGTIKTATNKYLGMRDLRSF
ncbi:hypothetical protein HZA99_03385 [Candidatus Woesearchaeota archaeon]|nr:hypothetical protein [Candidatus Woesearchaeota archaeon]